MLVAGPRQIPHEILLESVPRLGATRVFRMANASLIEIEHVGPVTIIGLSARCQLIEDALLEPLGAELLDVARTAMPPQVVLDLSRTKFFGSGFIEVLLRVWKELQQKSDSRLVLCGVQTYCREVLEITHLDQLWPMVATREDAIAKATEV